MAVTRRSLHVEDTRRALLSAARHEFATRGYAQASLDDIAARARLTKGALYHHFASKAAVLTAVYLELEQALAAQVAGLRAEGRLGPLPLDMAARMLLAAASEVAMSMAHADDPAAVQAEGVAVLDALVSGLELAARRA
jgi:AcrR family transcriptional regulator